MLSFQIPTAQEHQTNLAWYPANLAAINRRFESLPPQEVLRWALATYGRDLVLATGFGPSGVVLMHMVSLLKAGANVFYLQTDLLFPETMALRDELSARYDLHFVEVHGGLSLAEQAETFGPELWKSNPDLCCHLRKVEPLRRFLGDKKAWISGIRRDQSAARASSKMVGWDKANDLVKINPLAGWTLDDVWDYIHAYDLPYNSLHDEGYPSVGCIPCTAPVAPGEPERAGRWSGLGKTECGIHFQPDGTVIRLSQVRPS